MSLSHTAYFISPSMTVKHAAEEAAARHCTLRVSWTIGGGLLVVAVPRETTGEIYERSGIRKPTH